MSTTKLIISFVIFYFCKKSNGAITPLDETYTATAGIGFTIPWSYDFPNDVTTVDWIYKSPSATAITIMTKSSTNPAVVTAGYNVEEDIANGNGNIKLKTVTTDTAGIYYCSVSYSLSSGRQFVTGTATLSVTSAPDPDGGCSGGCIAGIIGGVGDLGVAAGAAGGVAYKKSKASTDGKGSKGN